MPVGRTSKGMEEAGNKCALKTHFWKKDVIQVRPHFLGLSMAKGIPATGAEAEEVERFVASKLEQALHYPTQRASKSFDFNKLRSLELHGMEKGLIQKIEALVGCVQLPATSAHGDFHLGNILFVGSAIKIIDWSMFSCKGSFITDYIHFYNFRNAVAHKESWSVAILKKAAYLESIASLCSTSPRHLRAVYCLSRISGELGLRKGAAHVHLNQIKKYNRILSFLTNE